MSKHSDINESDALILACVRAMASLGDIPPVTKGWLAAGLGAAVAQNLGVMPSHAFLLHWYWVIQRFELWRVATSLINLGGVGFALLARLAMIAQHGASLERAWGSEEFLFALASCGAALLPLPFFSPELFMVLGPSLCSAALYLWSRENQAASVSIMGFVSVPGKFLPFALAGMNVLMGMPPWLDVAGIVVAHLFRFLTTLMPRAGYSCPLSMPQWFRDMARKIPGVVDSQQTRGFQFRQGQAPGSSSGPSSSTRRRAFQGRPRRVAD